MFARCLYSELTGWKNVMQGRIRLLKSLKLPHQVMALHPRQKRAISQVAGLCLVIHV